MHLQFEKQQQSPSEDFTVGCGETTGSQHAVSLTVALSTEALHLQLFWSLDTRQLFTHQPTDVHIQMHSHVF